MAIGVVGTMAGLEGLAGTAEMADMADTRQRSALLLARLQGDQRRTETEAPRRLGDQTRSSALFTPPQPCPRERCPTVPGARSHRAYPGGFQSCMALSLLDEPMLV